jgi:hypothetical protein
MDVDDADAVDSRFVCSLKKRTDVFMSWPKASSTPLPSFADVSTYKAPRLSARDWAALGQRTVSQSCAVLGMKVQLQPNPRLAQ